MSTNLALLPLQPNGNYSATRLPVMGSYDFFDAIRKLPSRPIAPDTMALMGEDSAMSAEVRDAYGRPLVTVSVRDLRTLREHSDVRLSIENSAAWAYLGALDIDRRVILYWY